MDKPKGSVLWLRCPHRGIAVSLGARIKELRKEKNWSQDEFAASAQIDGRQVSRYENDRVVPSIEVIVKIARAFDVSIEFLLIEDAPRRPLTAPTNPLIDRIRQMGPMSADDERSLLHMLDAIAAKNRLKELAAKVG